MKNFSWLTGRCLLLLLFLSSFGMTTGATDSRIKFKKERFSKAYSSSIIKSRSKFDRGSVITHIKRPPSIRGNV